MMLILLLLIAVFTNATNNASSSCHFRACGGDTIVITGCADDNLEAYCIGETMLSLVDATLGRIIKKNDHGCGDCARIKYSVPEGHDRGYDADECHDYTVMQSCYSFNKISPMPNVRGTLRDIHAKDTHHHCFGTTTITITSTEMDQRNESSSLRRQLYNQDQGNLSSKLAALQTGNKIHQAAPSAPLTIEETCQTPSKPPTSLPTTEPTVHPSVTTESCPIEPTPQPTELHTCAVPTIEPTLLLRRPLAKPTTHALSASFCFHHSLPHIGVHHSAQSNIRVHNRHNSIRFSHFSVIEFSYFSTLVATGRSKQVFQSRLNFGTIGMLLSYSILSVPVAGGGNLKSVAQALDSGTIPKHSVGIRESFSIYQIGHPKPLSSKLTHHFSIVQNPTPPGPYGPFPILPYPTPPYPGTYDSGDNFNNHQAQKVYLSASDAIMEGVTKPKLANIIDYDENCQILPQQLNNDVALQPVSTLIHRLRGEVSQTMQ